ARHSLFDALASFDVASMCIPILFDDGNHLIDKSPVLSTDSIDSGIIFEGIEPRLSDWATILEVPRMDKTIVQRSDACSPLMQHQQGLNFAQADSNLISDASA